MYRPLSWPRAWRFACMVASLLCATGLSCAAAFGYSVTRASYTLTGTLPALAQGPGSIRGTGTITFTNGSSSQLSELAFHLYLNAYKDSNSVALRSSHFSGRANLRGGGFGRIEVHALTDLRDGSALVLKYSQADPDQTTASVELHQPLAPGATLQLHIEWTSSLPRLTQRTGHVQNYVFAGQWFPKLAKLEADGTFSQFSFHPQAEFYADFGDYDVTIEAPMPYVIAACGSQVSATHDATQQRVRFVAKQVHDFAWTAWPGYRVRSEQVGSTVVQLYSPSGDAQNADVTLATLRKALPFYEAWLGPYPYDTLTVVHPPSFAADAGGMEYPTLITTGGAWAAGYESYDVERVTLHELAHQWFYGLLASNEYAWPFLDEGLATFAADRAEQALLQSPSAVWTYELNSALQRQRATVLGHDFPVASAAADFPTFDHLSALAYERAALALDTLSRVYPDAFELAFQRYAQTNRMAHPTPDDLLSELTTHIGPAAANTMRQVLFERGWVNYRMVELDVVPQTSDPSSNASSRIVLSRQGTLAIPVTVEFEDSVGAVFKQRWDGGADTWQYVHIGKPIVRACVDPQHHVTLDADYIDNCVTHIKQSRTWLSSLVSSVLQLIVLGLSW